MSGAEIGALVLAGVSAVAGVKTATSGSSGRSSSKGQMTVVETNDYAYAKGRGCEAFADAKGAYAASRDGTAMAVWSGKYSSSSRR